MTSITLATTAPLRRWVGWRNETHNGRVTKVPYEPITGLMARSNDPAGWAHRSEADAWARAHVNGGGGGVGIQLGNVEGEDYVFGGVDLDSCREPTTGVIDTWAADVMARLGSYAEVSPSGTGVKVFFCFPSGDIEAVRRAMGTRYGKQFKSGSGQHPPAIELYIGNRYFTVTDQPVDGVTAELRLVRLETLLWLITDAGPLFKHRRNVAPAAIGNSNPGRCQTPDELSNSNAAPTLSEGPLDGELFAKLRVLMNPRAKLAARWNGSTAGLQDTSRSGMDMSMAQLLKQAGFSFEETKALLLKWSHGAGSERAGDDRYFRRLWGPEATTRPGAGAEPRLNHVLPEDAGLSARLINHSSEGCPVDARQTAKTLPLEKISIGSDNEIAECVAKDLIRIYKTIVFTEGQFWRYDLTHWVPIAFDEIWLSACRYDGVRFYTPGGGLAIVKLNKSRLESIIACMKPALTQRGLFVKTVAGINCASGFIHFSDGGTPALLEHNPEHRCRHVLAGRWPTDITKEQKEVSLLATLLNGCFQGDKDKQQKIDLIGEVAGIAALGGATKMQSPKALIMHGEDAENGKSQLINVVQSLLPAGAVSSIPPARFSDRTFVCRLAGKLLNATAELGDADTIASEVFKQIITGDQIMARDVYEKAFDFRPVAQHIHATNVLPSFKNGMDRGVRRRLIVLTLNRVIPKAERIEGIGARIGQDEPDLLLDWAVRGASRALAAGGFTEPASSRGALRDWMCSSDPVLAWLESDHVGYSSEHTVPETRTPDAYKQFKLWATLEGFDNQRELPSINGFSQRVVAAGKGIKKRRDSKGPIFIGLRCSGTPRA